MFAAQKTPERKHPSLLVEAGVIEVKDILAQEVVDKGTETRWLVHTVAAMC